ncbi:MAG: protein translocase SEC61 complex subunit gamma [Candidatus Thorarchaeota archaeon]|nr:MAG: protein translocase SEC61 complex subunit gamma [Candidatus Thorarchaeota archaeon]
MGLGNFIRESARILKLATKPSRQEFWSSTKISLLAMFLVGMLSFIVQLLMTALTSLWGRA